MAALQSRSRQAWLPGWARRSRDSRDTLWLLATLAWVMVPHASHLPWWCILGAVTALAWRARLAWREAPLPSRWWLVFLMVAAMVMTRLQYPSLISRESCITLVVILTTLKSLELKARRDALVCLYLGFFLIFTQFLYSQSLGTALMMLIGVWALLTSLVLGQRPLGHPPLREVGKVAVKAMFKGLPLMVLLFVLFPRFGPLWSSRTDDRHHTGLSNSIELGQIAELAQDDSIAMRLTFMGKPPAAHEMYFRGPTLDDFDGRTWQSAPRSQQQESIEAQGPRIDYELTLEPSPLRLVPLLDGSLQASVTLPTQGVTLRRQGVVWQQSGSPDQRLVIRAQAWPGALHGRDLSTQALQRWLALPRGFNPRTRAWAEALHARPEYRVANARTLAIAVIKHIRTENYRYTLSPGLPLDPNTPHLVDDFWLDRRAGFCEHFATAFVVVMRNMGVPARVVSGFQGAENNPMDGQYIVRNSQAHAWAEFWSPEAGWLRIDPTAAVAPERVEQAPRPRPLSLLPGNLVQVDIDTLRRIRSMWEAVDHRWNVWVLQYSRDQQMDVLKQLGWSSPDWNDLSQILGWIIGALGLGGSALLWLNREKTNRSEWDRPLRQLHQSLKQLDLGEPEGPQPASASGWRSHLALAWHEGSSLTQQSVLAGLDELDALRYGPLESSSSPQGRRIKSAQRQNRRRALTRIRHLVKALT